MKYFIILLTLLTGLTTCQKKELTSALPAKTNPNLNYFGYTLVDVGWDDPSDKNDKTNYVDEVHSFSNIADILVTSPEDNIIARLEIMDQVNVKAVIHLNEIFFEQTGEGGDKSGFIYGLRPDYQARWNNFILTNDLTNNHHLINSLYIGEEPAWNSIPESDFTLACDYIKQTLPQVPVFSVEAFAAIDEMYIPQSVDWVGFDHYFLNDPESDKDFLEEYMIMKSKMYSHQRIILIMDAHFIKFAHGSSGISKNDMDFIARAYYNIANADTVVVGILGYHWPNGFEFKSALGARGFPDHVLKEHQMIGKTITGK